jgi:lysophospholipase L1-like esterase
MSAPTTHRRTVGWIGPRTIACVLTLVALELALYHLGNFGKWVVQEQVERYGWQMLPDQDGWSREYDIPERINAWGFRDDRDWEAPRLDAEGRPAGDPHLFRVAVVGNSMTYGTSVPVDETWPQVLEGLIADELERRGDPRRALVMNFAVQGYTFEQMARLYEDRVRRWRPDLLVWPLLTPDMRPMRPARDDFDYGFRRLVIRTAIYDFLRRHVIHRWIPEPGVEEPARDAATGKRRLWDAVAPGVEEALVELYGAEWRDRNWPALAERAREALERVRPERAVARLLSAVAGELPPGPEGADPVLAVWGAIERGLTEQAWSHLDTNFKEAPFQPQHQFLWELRGRRMLGILSDVERQGGRVVLYALPSTPRLVYGIPSPMLYWGGEWARTATGHGHAPVLADGEPAFEPPMAELVEDIRRRGWIEDERGRRLSPDYAGIEKNLFLMRDPGHYNSAGHERLARDLFEHLRRAGLFEEARR